MAEAPPYVEGANERSPTDYPIHGSTFIEPPPLFAAEKVNAIHAILNEHRGEEALKRIREVIYDR